MSVERPMGECRDHDRRVVIERRGALSLGGFFACLTCDMIPVDGHPVYEQGWSRAEYEREQERRRGAPE